MLGEIWIWPMCCLQPWFIHHLDCPPHLTLSEPWLWTTYKVAEADHGTWRGTWGQCHEHRSYIHVDIIFFMWILFIHVARWMCNMYSINSKLIQCRRERNEMCILDRCDRLVYLPFLLYEVTIGTIGCWWYPFSNSIFIGVLVLEKTGQVPQIGSGNHCPHCFLGAFHGPGSGISSMSIHLQRWSPQLNDRCCGLVPFLTLPPRFEWVKWASSGGENICMKLGIFLEGMEPLTSLDGTAWGE